MFKISYLKNVIQDYAWGSTTAIPELLGQANPSKTPQAELWMGAHPKAPSEMLFNNKWVTLLDVINAHPVEMLGDPTAKQFKNQLPYLFKVLAAEKPLSIQAHPSLKQAQEGFARENLQNIPLNAFNRNYKDDNHKPECICAITDFWALNGFRPFEQIIEILNKLCPDALNAQLSSLKNNKNPTGLEAFFKELLSLVENDKKILIDTVINKTRELNNSKDPILDWILKLFDEYQYDIGILAPVLLNLICLRPGEALFLPSGQLHAYLSGVGIELMANSDNVLRGGLTPKHIDVPELINVLNFKPTAINVLLPEKIHNTEAVYHTPVKEFQLSTIHVENKNPYISPKVRTIEILLCTNGKTQLKSMSGRGEPIEVQKGVSVVIPADIAQYKIEGRGQFFKAAVPLGN